MIEQQTTFCYFGEYHSCWQNLHNFRASVVEGTLIRRKLQECIFEKQNTCIFAFQNGTIRVFFFLLIMILDDYPFLKIKIVCFNCHHSINIIFWASKPFSFFIHGSDFL